MKYSGEAFESYIENVSVMRKIGVKFNAFKVYKNISEYFNLHFNKFYFSRIVVYMYGYL